MPSKGGAWWKWGCGGCLAILGLFAIAVAVVFLMARGAAESEQVESQVFEPELPGAGVEVSPGEEAREILVAGTTEAAGLVVLDLSEAEFRIEPAASGEPLRIEAKYDVNSYELVEGLEAEEGAAWVYRASFRRKRASFVVGLKEMLFGGGPEVLVLLPRDVPLDLEFNMKRGGIEMELGGLWLRNAELKFLQGGFALGFDEPLREPMHNLTIHGSMGGFAAKRIGNASPAVLDLEVSMGGMAIDLRGAWRNDAELSVRTSMGGGALHLPRDVILEGIPLERPRPQPSPEVQLPTLRFSPATTFDDLEIID